MFSLIYHQLNGWLPQNHAWLNRKAVQCDSASLPVQLLPVIQDFQKLIEDDAEIYIGFHQMFEQVPTKPPYDKDPIGKPQVCDVTVIQSNLHTILKASPRLLTRFATISPC